MNALALALLLGAPREETLAAWDRAVERTESRIQSEISSEAGFLALDFVSPEQRRDAARALRAGEVFVKKLTTGVEVPSGQAHHWLGAVFVPDASVEDLVRWLQQYDEHARRFEDVEDSRLLDQDGDRFSIFLKLRRKKIVTVHYATEHEVLYRRHGPGRFSSASRALRIAELENAGTPEEREKPPSTDRGFLWRLHSYWRFQQVPRGVIVECESLSLSRGVPAAVRWIVSPYLDSVPRESLESTLLPIRSAFHRIEGRMKALENRMGGIENRVGGLESPAGGLENRMGALENRMEAGFTNVRKHIEQVRVRLDSIERMLSAQWERGERGQPAE
jgi:hypothetical protein